VIGDLAFDLRTPPMVLRERLVRTLNKRGAAGLLIAVRSPRAWAKRINSMRSTLRS